MIFENIYIEVKKEHLKSTLYFLYNNNYCWKNETIKDAQIKYMLGYKLDVYYIFIGFDNYLSWSYSREAAHNFKLIDFNSYLREHKLKRIMKLK